MLDHRIHLHAHTRHDKNETRFACMFCLLVLAEDEGETKHLQALDGADTRLRLFQMDLLDPSSSMRPAIEGARGVFHLASPLTLQTQDPEAILPAESFRSVAYSHKRRLFHRDD